MPNTIIWAIHDHPDQYPDSYVLQLLKTEEGKTDIVPTDHLLATPDLEVLRNLMRRWGMRCIPRHLGNMPKDMPKIMEMWL
jgi:hypothetical protein